LRHLGGAQTHRGIHAVVRQDLREIRVGENTRIRVSGERSVSCSRAGSVVRWGERSRASSTRLRSEGATRTAINAANDFGSCAREDWVRGCRERAGIQGKVWVHTSRISFACASSMTAGEDHAPRRSLCLRGVWEPPDLSSIYLLSSRNSTHQRTRKKQESYGNTSNFAERDSAGPALQTTRRHGRRSRFRAV
jgi:hypothetical protein